MTVIAFVDGSSWDRSVIEHAAWAAKTTGQSITVVAQDELADNEPAMAYDAYQQMNPREDMFHELSAQARRSYSEIDAAALETARAAAKMAKDLEVERVRATTTSDPFAYFIENFTDSGDLLVVPRRDGVQSRAAGWLDQFLRVRSRVMLLVPETYSSVESWMIAIDGKPAIGRVIDFLSGRGLLKDTPGTAVIVGDDYQGRIHFRDAVRHLQSSHHHIISHELKGNADDVLAAVLAVSPVDMLVMGAYGQGRFRLLTEHTTTSRMLETFHGPVLVSKA